MDYSQYAASSSNFLKAPDLNGEKAVLTIVGSEVDSSEFQGQARDQVVLHFEETEKKLGMNKTQLRTVIALYGPDGDNWVGKGITLFETFAPNPSKGGALTPVIGIEPKAPKETAEKGLAASI